MSIFDISNAELKLMAGEMTAKELRTVRAVLKGLKARAQEPGQVNDELVAARYEQLKADPESAMHLLRLLSIGKGTPEDFDRMLDRIRASKEAALARHKGAQL